MRRSKTVPVLPVVILSLFAIPFIAAPRTSTQPTPQMPAQTRTQAPSVIPKSGIGGSKLQVKAQSSEGGMWRTDGTFSPTFMLMNGLAAASMKVTPVLYMADGTEFDLPEVQLDPSGVAMINIVNALRDAPPNIQSHISTFGSAATKFQWPWPVVGAAILNRDQVRSLVYQTHLQSDAVFTHDPATKISAQVMQSTWWKAEPDVTGFTSLTNTSLKPITATVTLSDGGTQHSVKQQVSLAPHATAWVDLSQLWIQLPSGVIAGGLDIAYSGPQGGISASGGLQDADKGYSQMLHFREHMQMPSAVSPLNTNTSAKADVRLTPISNVIRAPSQTESMTLDSTGIMMGKQDADMQFPQGTIFAPYMVLRNTTANSVPVKLAVNTMASSGPKDASLGTITLDAFESRQVDMKPLLASAGLNGYNGYINLQTTFGGSSGDVMVETGSIDPTFNYVFEVPAHVEQDTGSQLFNYWNTNGDTDSMFTLWNYSATPQDFVLTFFHQEGKYELPIHLAPHASMTMSMAKLVRGGVQDRNGKVIPANIVQGSAKISGIHNNREKISVAVFGGTFNSRTGTCYYMCRECDGVVDGYTDPTSMSLTVGGSGSGIACMVVLYDGSEEDGTEDVTLSSSNGSIASATFGVVYPGTSGGTATISGSGTFPGIGYDGQELSCEGCQTVSVNFSCSVTVTNPSTNPTVTSISPTCIVIGTTISAFEVDGTGFNSPSPVPQLPTGITTTGLTSWTDTQAIFPITASGSASPGNLPVFVKVNGHSSNQDVLLKIASSCP
jgi:hypothetical protein